jgi:hypothetical protein
VDDQFGCKCGDILIGVAFAYLALGKLGICCNMRNVYILHSKDSGYQYLLLHLEVDRWRYDAASYPCPDFR